MCFSHLSFPHVSTHLPVWLHTTNFLVTPLVDSIVVTLSLWTCLLHGQHHLLASPAYMIAPVLTASLWSCGMSVSCERGLQFSIMTSTFESPLVAVSHCPTVVPIYSWFRTPFSTSSTGRLVSPPIVYYPRPPHNVGRDFPSSFVLFSPFGSHSTVAMESNTILLQPSTVIVEYDTIQLVFVIEHQSRGASCMHLCCIRVL